MTPAQLLQRATDNHLAKARSYTTAYVAANESGDPVPLRDAKGDLETAALEFAAAYWAVRQQRSAQ